MNDTRCIDPVAKQTGYPWYNNTNNCPCGPGVGRVYTTCPLGINKQTIYNNISNASINIPFGNMYNNRQITPPLYDPRPSIRIGYEWRN